MTHEPLFGDEPDNTAAIPLSLHITRLAGAAAFAVALYLAFLGLTGETAAGCGPDSVLDCQSVLQSRFARWFGVVPVGIPAALAYLALIVTTGLVIPDRTPSTRRVGRLLLVTLATAILASVAWMVGLQAFWLEAWCLWCLADHALGAVAAVAALALARPPVAADAPESESTSARGVLGALIAGLVLTAGLVTGQLLSSESTLTGRMITGPGQVEDDGKPLFLDGQIRIGADDVPRLGPADAEHFIAKVFDYTCPHCQRLSKMLNQVQTRYDGQLSILLVPAPLDG
ncbi:MAG: vitamin K epoxide reductase family protein, partial [Phycisphaeraceae bacterium]|nr:vitamin K epoxide reductase family protein [Phycisphaeraceae bacterium]